MDNKFAENTKKRLNKITGYVLWVLILLLSLSLVRNISISARIKAAIAAEKAKVAKMEDDNKSLESQIAQTQSGLYIEKQIRDKLGLVKAGEAIVVLPDEETLKKLAPPEAADSQVLPDPNWQKWIKLFI